MIAAIYCDLESKKDLKGCALNILGNMWSGIVLLEIMSGVH
jgi:hypothetical protein